MLLSQVLIPAATAFAVLVSAVLGVVTVRRSRPTPSIEQVQATVLEGFEAYLGRTYLVGFAVAAALALAAGGAIGGFERSLETGALVGGALVVGALAVAIPAIAGSMLLVRAPAALAGAAQAYAVRAMGAALRGGAAAALLGGAFSIGAVTGLFAMYSSVLDKGPQDALVLTLALAAGAASMSLVTQVTGGLVGRASANSSERLADVDEPIPLTDPRNPGVSARLVGVAASGIGVLTGLCGLQILGMLLSLAAGAPLYGLTGKIGWLLLPLMLPAAGLAISAVVVLVSRVFASDSGRGNFAGLLFTLLLGAGTAAALSFAAIDERWWWFAACAGAGLLGAAAVAVVGTRTGRQGGPADEHEEATVLSALATVRSAGMRTGIAFLVVTGLTLVGAYVLGEQGASRPISEAQAGIFGVALALSGLLMPLGYLAASHAAAIAAANGRSLAVIAFDVTPESREVAATVEARALRGSAAARSVAVAGTGLVAVLAVTLVLQLVRADMGTLAASDPERYASLVQDLGIAPPGRDVNAAITNAVDQYGALLEEARVAIGNTNRFGEREVDRLAGVDRAEAEALVGVLLDGGGVNARDVRHIEGNPYPLPRVVPLSLSRVEVWAGLLAGVAMGVFLFSRAAGAVARGTWKLSEEVLRQYRGLEGIRTGEVRADYARASDETTKAALRACWWPLLLAVALPAVMGIGLRYAFGGNGNEGWLAGAGLVAGLGLAAVVALAIAEGTGIAAREWRALAEAPRQPGEGGSTPEPGQAALEAAHAVERWAALDAVVATPALVTASRLATAVALVLIPLMVR
ncbi:MAG TPA: sodium/proton-translocating pyrophosphatase [Tepidiformaceae bacterium]|nr:sodium/proton-translocating pyrophosphatase [Tepidiformaceae bacterium]